MKELHLLIVEDDPNHYKLMQNALEGVHVAHMHHFESGEGLLAFLGSCAQDDALSALPFCILLDLGLPGLSGAQVLQRLKERPDWARIPVIVLTSNNDPSTIAQCHQLGCSHFVAKPLDLETFTLVISKMGLFVNLVELPVPFRKV